MTQLVSPLPEGPLDIIGDVHGEYDALEQLLGRLGCDPAACTAERPLVFVGDLIDRGPDSPAVVELVMRLVDAGVAHCIVGNHELNVLWGKRKEGNGWWFGDTADTHHYRHEGQVHTEAFPSVVATPSQGERFRDFFASLPLALTREDLRVVHACWHDASIAALPAHGDAAAIVAAREARIDQALAAEGLLVKARQEREAFAGLTDLEVKPDRPLHAHPKVSAAQQNDNPIKVLTSGLERRVSGEQLKFLSGKWRLLERVSWWNDYDQAPAVVVGHYWRRRTGARVAGKPDAWGTERDTDWTGPRGNVFCVDYSVGRRFLERATGQASSFDGGLAAMRWPERTLVFDDEDQPRPTTKWQQPSGSEVD